MFLQIVSCCISTKHSPTVVIRYMRIEDCNFYRNQAFGKRIDHLFVYFWPGGPLVSEVGYHPRKRTFKTHPKHVFSGMKIEIDPK